MLEVSFSIFVVDHYGMQCAILFAPVKALYLVLDQIMVVLCKVPKHHNLVRTERFLPEFHVS